MALTESTMLELGTTAPDFALTDVVTGKTVRRDDFRGNKGLLVLFICAHCPYVKHVEKGLAAFGKDYSTIGGTGMNVPRYTWSVRRAVRTAARKGRET